MKRPTILICLLAFAVAPAPVTAKPLDDLLKLIKPKRKGPAEGSGAQPGARDGTPLGATDSATAYDIAGMRLGMSPAEIRAVMVRAGFTPRATDPDQDSWEARVTRAVAARRPVAPVDTKVPMFTMASGPRGEHVEVWYYAGPAGPAAGSVKYHMPTNQMTAAAFNQAVLAKYGAPTHRSGADMFFCSKGETACLPWANKRRAYLTAANAYSFHELYLAYGQDANEASSAAFKAEVERRAPKDAKPTF